LNELKEEYCDAFFVSAARKKGVGFLKKCLNEMAGAHERASLRVGVVGYPNAGKSSLINAMIGSQLKVKSVSGTTKKTAWLRMGRVRIQDSPGVIPARDDKVALGLTASKDPHKMKNVENVALSLLGMGKVGESVKGFYGVDRVLSDYDALLEIGKRKGFLLKGGIVDVDRASVLVVEDWQKGRIGLR